MKRVLLLMSLGALQGCAFVYDQVQDRAQTQCARPGDAQAQRACEKSNAPAYDDYEARRKRLQQGDKG